LTKGRSRPDHRHLTPIALLLVIAMIVVLTALLLLAV
jgi:hypothetical protein